MIAQTNAGMIVKITCGLPGSGKSVWAKGELKRLGQNYTKLIDVDQVFIGLKSIGLAHTSNVFQDITMMVNNRVDHLTKVVILDGLFTQQAEYEQLLVQLRDLKGVSKFEFHFWNEARAACLANDAGRRPIDSKVSIRFMLLEKPDVDKLKLIYPNVGVVEHMIERVVESGGKRFDFTRIFGEEIRSEEWCLGGEWGNYTGASGEVKADQPLTEFKEFDDLLLKIAPSIGILQYKKLYNDCVTVHERHEKDYYSAGVDYACFKCDLGKLYDGLVSLGIIEG